MENSEQQKIMYLGTSSYKIESLYTDKRFKTYKFDEPFAATAFLKDNKMDAVICDLKLKNMNGFEYFEKFSRHGSF